MTLKELLKYEEIIIQCHDNPDADAIGSGFALYTFFKEKGKQVRLVYSGKAKITKPNLLILLNELSIPLEYAEEIDVSGLLITVDCQYGAGNVKKFKADNVAIIDHHRQEITNVPLSEIRYYLGSCSTLVWQMLEEEGFAVNEHPDIATALYYGLLTDTNNFTEINHPYDRDMKDTLAYDLNLIRKLKYSNLTIDELKIAGMALLKNSYDSVDRFSLVKTQPCDPNILGFIGDLAIQVDSVDVCVVYYEVDTGIKFSVRSCVREVMACELAEYISEGIGSGGGHSDKAGGFVFKCELNRRYPGKNTEQYLVTRLKEYYETFTVIDCTINGPDLTDMEIYKKRPSVQGYVKCTDIFKKGTPVIVRTLRCDMDNLLSDDDLYIVIGIKGDVHPIFKDKFLKGYEATEEPFAIETQYFPHIIDKNTGSIVDLKPYAKKCISTGEVYIYAKPLSKTTKLFTLWDRDTYMLGKPGDYLAVREDDENDAYIVSKDIFELTYKK